MDSIRVGVVGMGIIGKRVALAIQSHSALSLVGIGIRSAAPAALAFGELDYFSTDPSTVDIISAAGIQLAGTFDDLLAACDVVVDCGQAGTGASRAGRYASHGVAAVFCGGERSRELGPLVSPPLNYRDAVGRAVLRVASCNTTAVARLVAAIGRHHAIDDLDLEATFVRCATDTDKAFKGVVNGAVVPPAPTHHSGDLKELLPGASVYTAAVSVPMTTGHVAFVRAVASGLRADDLAAALANDTRIVSSHEETFDSSRERDRWRLLGRRWGDRPELLLLRWSLDSGVARFAVGIDNESVAIPDTLDAVQAVGGERSEHHARRRSDEALGLHASPPMGRDLSLRPI